MQERKAAFPAPVGRSYAACHRSAKPFYLSLKGMSRNQPSFALRKMKFQQLQYAFFVFFLLYVRYFLVSLHFLVSFSFKMCSCSPLVHSSRAASPGCSAFPENGIFIMKEAVFLCNEIPVKIRTGKNSWGRRLFHSTC